MDEAEASSKKQAARSKKQETEKAVDNMYEGKIKTYKRRVKDLKEERARLQGRVRTLDQQLRERHEDSATKSGEPRKRGKEDRRLVPSLTLTSTRKNRW
jgi:hypothetical protein